VTDGLGLRMTCILLCLYILKNYDFIIILLLVIALGVGIYFFTKDSTSEEVQEKNDKSVILVTDEGSVYKNKPNKTEGYISRTYVPDPAPTEFRLGYLYDVNVGGLDKAGAPNLIWKDGKCVLDGTLDCLYHMREKDGKIVAFTNEKGEDLTKKLADDIYSGKISTDDESTKLVLTQFRLTDDGELQWKKRCDEVAIEEEKTNPSIVESAIAGGHALCNTWQNFTVFSPTELGPVGFFLVLLLLSKRDGLPKPRFEINLVPPEGAARGPAPPTE
jgi:hypothetical protein